MHAGVLWGFRTRGGHVLRGGAAGWVYSVSDLASGAAEGSMTVDVRVVCGHSDPRDRLKRWDESVELLLPGRWRRPGGGEGNTQVVDDLVDDRVVGDEGYDLHFCAAVGTDEGIDLIDLPDEFPPAG